MAVVAVIPLTVLTANVYIGNPRKADTKERIAETGADLVGLQEAAVFGTVPGYRRKGPVDGSRGRREVPVLVRRTPAHLIHSWRTVQSSPDRGSGMLHDRWTNVVRVTVRGARVSLLNSHVQPLLQGADGTLRARTPQVRDARAHLHQLAELAAAERAAGWAPIITLDSNYRRPLYADELWYHSPHRLFPRLGLQYIAQGVDGIAFDREAFTVHKHKGIRLPGSDHRGLLLLLGVR